MLEQLLAEIRRGGPLTTTILAGRLHTSVEMVNVLLERLVQFGFVQNIEPPCEDSGCHGCSLSGMCKKTSPIGNRLWALS